MRPKLPTGTNLRLLLTDCTCAPERLTRYGAVLGLAEEAVRSCDMTPLASAGHDFPDAGHSLCLILAESHLAIHTYPEASQTVIVELSVCDHLRPNRDRATRLAQRLIQIFEPRAVLQEESSMRPRLSYSLGPGLAVAVDVDVVPERHEGPRLVETAGLGLAALSASDEIDWCEADGPWTDEPLIHVPLLLHPRPRAVMLYQPAGDAAAVEVLRHREVERLFLVEEERRPGLRSRQLPDDPRLMRVDSAEQLAELGLADLIVLPALQALPPATLSAATARLRPGGLLAFRVPFPEVGAARRYAEHRPTFYWQHTPSRGRAVFAICGALPRLPVERDVAARMVSRGLVGLRVVSAATLPAMFALPPLLRAELEL